MHSSPFRKILCLLAAATSLVGGSAHAAGTFRLSVPGLAGAINADTRLSGSASTFFDFTVRNAAPILAGAGAKTEERGDWFNRHFLRGNSTAPVVHRRFEAELGGAGVQWWF